MTRRVGAGAASLAAVLVSLHCPAQSPGASGSAAASAPAQSAPGGGAPQAQPEPSSRVRTHDRFYFRMCLSLGYGNLFVEPAGGQTTFSGYGPGVAALFGGTVKHFVIGGGLWYLVAQNGLRSSVEGGASRSVADGGLISMFIGPFVDYYFDPREGWHLLGSLGGVATAAGDETGSDVGAGAGVLLGGGYDFWVADQWSFGVMASFIVSPDMQFASASPANFTADGSTATGSAETQDIRGGYFQPTLTLSMLLH